MGQKKNKKLKSNRSTILNEHKMEYKYPPIYKYGFLLLTIYMLMKHQKIMTQDKLLTNSIIITVIVGLIDYIIINNHPFLFADDYVENFEESSGRNYNDYDEFDDLDHELLEDYDLSIEKELESLNSQYNKYSDQNINYDSGNPNQSNRPDSNTIQINYLRRIPQGNQIGNNSRQYYSTGSI